MTQTYTDPLALQRMDDGLCPECGQEVDEHIDDNRFWIPRSCDLRLDGVRDRIQAYQRSKVPDKPKPFYPVCETCDHAHQYPDDHYGRFEGCCAYCPGCEELEAPVTRNTMISVVHHANSPGTGWEHQWCRGITAKGRPCRRREFIYIISDTEPEQYYCPSHIKQDPTSKHFAGRVATKDS